MAAAVRHGLEHPDALAVADELIDSIARDLQAHEDLNLSEKLFGDADGLKLVVQRHLHCG
jgi:hypothetical protein